MQATHNTLSENVRTQTAELLNKHLAAAIDLHGQLKQAHWNVRGPNFIAIYELFDKVTGEVATERSFLVPYPLRIADENQHMFAVATTLAAFGQPAREAIGQSAAIGDADTADLFTEISRGVDHQLWLVESHVAPR